MVFETKSWRKKLASFMREMATKAKFTIKKPYKHLVQKLRNENVAPTDIMQIRRHKICTVGFEL